MKFSEKTKAILELAERLNYVTVSEGLKESITRISKMLYSIIHKLRT